MWKKLFAWLDERLALNDLYKAILDRPEPKGNWWNTLGSASLFLFLLQGATGIFLTRLLHPLPRPRLRQHPVHHERRRLRLADPRHPSLGRHADGAGGLHPLAACFRDRFL